MQTRFHFKEFDKRKDCFGGSLLGKSHPKQRRPLHSTRPIHLVLRAGASVLRQNQVALKIVNGEVQRWSKRCGVTIYRWANVGNHTHFAIRIGRVNQWPKFIRGLTGSIARKFQTAGLITFAGIDCTSCTDATTFAKVTNGNTTSSHTQINSRTTTRKFWQCRPYTRIVRSWKKAFKTLLEYIHMNQLEALGILKTKDRAFYKEMREQWSESAEWPLGA